MEGQFSFLGDPIDSIFSYTGNILPGVEKVIGVYFSSPSKELNILSMRRDGPVLRDYDVVLSDRESLVMIQRQRSGGPAYQWIGSEELPFDRKRHTGSGMDLFSEFENMILVLRYRNEYDHLFDLLYLYIQPSPGSFGMNRSDSVLTIENKNLIGHILYHYFNGILGMARKNQQLLAKVSQNVRSLVRENLLLKEEAGQARANYGESMVNLCRQYLSELSGMNQRRYVLTEAGEEKIRSFAGNIRHLEAIIQNAAIFADNILQASSGDLVPIEAYCLNFDEYQATIQPDEAVRKIDSRESRTIQLLDKLEKGAQSVKARNLPLTSINVGKALPQPISAPAITDALKKHRKLIIQMMGKFPDKWDTIRTEFKPLLNALRQDKRFDAREAGA
jgi:hypothetical protein